MEPRYYQQGAVDAIYAYLQARAGNPCVVLPTGAGKSLVIAMICRDAVIQWSGRVLVLAHVKELLQQNADELRALCPTIQIGVYSAGLNRREYTTPVVVAGIQSVHDKAALLCEAGVFNLIIVDEAHLIPESGTGMYRTFFRELEAINPDIRIIGLTATPYRLTSGPLCSPDGILNEICYEATVKELVNKKYLCPMVNKSAVHHIDTSAVDIVRGEYDEDELQSQFMAEGVIESAVKELIEYTVHRKAVLVFCQNIAHAERVALELRYQIASRNELAWKILEHAREKFGERVDDIAYHPIIADWLESENHDVTALRGMIACPSPVVEEIYGDTTAELRARYADGLRTGRVKYLVNVNVLTTGFNAKNIDCIAILRATISPGLYYQMVGRGFRLHPDKENCLVLDYGENIKRHGPVDIIKPRKKAKETPGETPGKVCEECHTVVPAAVRVCPDCGYMFPIPDVEAKHNSKASDERVISGEAKTEKAQVQAVTYNVHRKKNASDDAPKTLKVTYQIGMAEWVSEWVCIEHTGWARTRAEDWWYARSNMPCPDTAIEAYVIATHGMLADATEITYKTTPGDPFPKIMHCKLKAKPTRPKPCQQCGALNRLMIQQEPGPPHWGKIVCGECGRFHGWASREMGEIYGHIEDGRTEFPGMLEEPEDGWPEQPVDETLADTGSEPDEFDLPPEMAMADDIPF